MSADASDALFSFVAVATTVQNPPGAVRLPGLDPERTYRVEVVEPGHRIKAYNHHAGPAWWTTGAELRGATLATVGLQAPGLAPEHLVVVKATAVETEGTAR